MIALHNDYTICDIVTHLPIYMLKKWDVIW